MRPLTVLICDDEPYVVELLKRLVDWDAYGMSIVATAYDGVTAYNLMCSEKPDIILSDIRMSGMSGIELAEAASHLPRTTHFIMISGYKQFDYAYSAFKNGVEDYLLKPIKAKELSAVLNRLCEKIDQDNQTRELESIRVQYEQSQSLVQQMFLKQFWEHSLPPVLSLQLMQEEYRFELPGKYTQLCAAAFDQKLPQPWDQASADALLETFETHASEELERCTRKFYTYAADNCVLVLVSFDSIPSLRQCWERLFIAMRQPCGSAYRMTIAMGPAVKDANTISDSCAGLETALAERYICSSARILEAEKHVREEPRSLLSYSQWLRLEGILEILDSEALNDFFQDIHPKVFTHCREVPALFIDFVDYLENMCTLLLRKYHSKLCSDAAMATAQRWYLASAEEVWSQLYLNILHMIQSIQQLRDNMEDPSVRLAKKYIQEHLHEDITLETLGKVVYLNPSYFCTLFKREACVSFQDYILECRLLRAKMLLKDTQKSILAISEDVGYRDSRYFSKLFKNRIGMTPKEFRRLFGGR